MEASAFDPKDAAYEYLAVGEEEVITVNYRVTDPGLNGAAGLFAEKTFTITVKGTNDDPVVDLNGIATLANATEDTTYEVSVNQLLQGFSDADATDVLTVEALTAYKADEFGQPTPDIAGFVSPVLVGDVLSGYEFTPLDDFFGDVKVFTLILFRIVRTLAFVVS